MTKFYKSVLFENIFYLFSLQFLNYLLPLFIMPFLFVKLGNQIFGIMSMIYSLCNLLNIFVAFGFDLYSTREIALNRNSTKMINKIFFVTYYSKFILLFFGGIILFLATYWIDDLWENRMSAFLMYGIVVGNFLFPNWFFQGMEKMKYMTFVTLSAKLCSLLPMFFLIKSDDDLIVVAICYSIGYVFVGVYSFIYVKIKYDLEFVKFRLMDVYLMLKRTFYFFLSRVSASLYNVLGTFILGTFCSAEVAGYYNISEKIVAIFNAIASPINQALYPYMTNKERSNAFSILFYGGSILGFIACLVCYIYADIFIDLLFKTSNIAIINSFQILLIACLFTIPSHMIGYPFLGALGYNRYVNKSVITSGICYLGLLGLLLAINRINIYTISFLLVFCEFLVFLIRIYGIKRYSLAKNIMYVRKRN